MVDDPEAIYETWLDCYETAYQNPAGIRDLACPNCAQRMLALRFDVKVMEADLGIAKFWCESCFDGIDAEHGDSPGRRRPGAVGRAGRAELPGGRAALLVQVS
jgi:hypothetical protein